MKLKEYIIIVIVGITLIIISVLILKPKRDKTTADIPQGRISQLPKKVQGILKELENEEYMGLAQEQIEKKLRQKGIAF